MPAASPELRPNERLDVLFDQATIHRRIEELAEAVGRDLNGEPVLAVGILKGSFLFLADFVRQMAGEVTVDFIQTSSWGDGKSSTGVVQIKKDLDVNIEGRNVLLVEDIVDTGLTLSHLRELLGTRHPKTLRVVSLLSKPEARRQQTQVEYVGFEIPNEFVVGYGLDYAERFRNLPYIAILREEG